MFYQQEELYMENLFCEQQFNVLDKDEYIDNTDGHWVDLEPGQFVRDGEIYQKVYTKSCCKAIKCPICNTIFKCSDYLSEIFKEKPKVEWLANMVTHYRHEHTKWDNAHGYYSKAYNQNKYDEEKEIRNERAKRQIIRNCKQFLLDNEFKVEDFLMLQNTDSKTIELAQKILGTKE